MNDRFPYFDVPIYMAGSYDQFLAQLVVDPIRPVQNFDQTVEFEKWSKYKNLSAKSVENTFKYIFYKFKKGIFVQIRNNNVVTFLPFSNENYVNELSFKIKVDTKKYKNILELINKIQVLKNYKPILKLKPINKWTMNDPLVRYDTPKKIVLGHHVLTIKHMLEKLCEQETDVPDVDFFINNRDFPLLKEDDTEPYQHILGTSRHPLISHNYSSYCPILSMVTSYKYTDIPIPTYECWIRAWCTETETAVDSQPFMEPIKLQTPWDSKLSKAVFRGSSTGAGVTIETNQRLKVCLKLAQERPDLIDAGITKWNLRPRKYKGSKYLETIELDAYNLANFLTPQQQADNYKYILCLEGHVAAFRLSRELTYGAVVLLPETAYDLWFMTYLKPWIHYVPIKHDCSDLIEKITWCIKHDNKCKIIMENALNFVAQNLNVKETFKYLKSVFNQITGHYQYFNPIMYVDRITKNYFESLSFIVKDFPYNIPAMFRTAGYLDGTRLIFEGCPKMKRLKLLTQTNFMTETLYSFNNIKCVKRTYYNIALTHYEAYIGIHAINKCCSKIPNFTYVYGILPMDPKSVYLEYIEAPTLKEWLNSPKFSKTELINIICQLTCALKEAEMTAGIRHFNLSIETVKILSVEQPIQLNYHDGKSNIISITVQNIAIIDYYYRASAVIYYKEIDGPLILQQCDFENTSSSNSDIIGLIIEIPYLKNIISLTVGTFGSHWNYKHK
ncbi:hypothetical protein LCDV1gp110 [Lymphocystis disease virus 1]|uniref:hypothetical protein n=1 Tax=Fish lymphocystis disease virus TaxID=36363 RepID=UPI0000161EA5|nr:hypothetical protein LCDV1gp110 [Lymphocystis disease virus 1]